MNEILKSLYERKSVRVFESQPISEDIKESLFSAAIEAPTAGCQSLCTMIDVTDQKIKDTLAVLCDNQSFIARAPLVVVFLADCRRWLDSYRYAGEAARPPAESDLLLAVADSVIAAQNTVVAAEAFGIGSCYIGDIMEHEEELRVLLDLDRYVFPAAMLVYGYPSESQKQRQKPSRFDRRYLVLENKYRRLDEQEHREMFQDRVPEGMTFESYLSTFCKRKYMSEFALEMARSAKVYLRNYTGSEENDTQH